MALSRGANSRNWPEPAARYARRAATVPEITESHTMDAATKAYDYYMLSGMRLFVCRRYLRSCQSFIQARRTAEEYSLGEERRAAARSGVSRAFNASRYLKSFRNARRDAAERRGYRVPADAGHR